MIAIYYLLSLISGFVLTLQIGVNGTLSSKIQNPMLASLISFAIGTIGLAVVFGVSLLGGSTTMPSSANIKNISWWMLTGGLLGAFYIFSTIYLPPKVGVANMISLVICGQIILAVAFDHFGLLGNDVHLLTPMRSLGVALLIAGVYIIQTH